MVLLMLVGISILSFDRGRQLEVVMMSFARLARDVIGVAVQRSRATWLRRVCAGRGVLAFVHSDVTDVVITVTRRGVICIIRG